jgi:pyruvate formate lyase activating enzyme
VFLLIGSVFEIINGSCVDGPGLRTTIFFKGCNMRCKWCHNPEGIDYKGGKFYSVDELLEKVLKYKNYFGENGGVTLSGGECMIQSDFISELLKKCKENNIHTVVDTAGYVEWKEFEKVIPYTDLFLYDLKCYSEELHIKNTGVSNKLILSNLYKLSKISDIIVRIPIIPTVNTDENELDKMSLYLENIKKKGIELLPYHSLGEDKYKKLGIDFNKYEVPSKQDIEYYNSFFYQ